LKDVQAARSDALFTIARATYSESLAAPWIIVDDTA
jgi:hypothetical protein